MKTDNNLRVSLRGATKEDTEFAREAHHKGYRNTVESQFGQWDETLQDSLFLKDWETDGFEIILFDGKKCGYTRKEFTPGIAKLRNLTILPEFQNLRIGTFILHNFIEEAQNKNLRAQLQVLKKNRAIKLYKKIGFKPVGETETHINMEYSPE